jgi:hypothetical protein
LVCIDSDLTTIVNYLLSSKHSVLIHHFDECHGIPNILLTAPVMTSIRRPLASGLARMTHFQEQAECDLVASGNNERSHSHRPKFVSIPELLSVSGSHSWSGLIHEA